jgi:hypothetical protein
MKFNVFVTAIALIAANVASAQEAGFYGDVEVLALRWSDTDGDDFNSDFNTASRVTLGYAFDGGRSIRLRHFDFSAQDQNGGSASIFDVQHTDLEYAGTFSLGQNWDGELSLGLRVSSIETPQVNDWPELYGPVLGVRLTSRLSESFSLYAGGRHAILFGEEINSGNDHHISMSELSAGVEWTKGFRVGTLAVHAGLEAQNYASIRDDEEDYGLVGWTLGASFRF